MEGQSESTANSYIWTDLLGNIHHPAEYVLGVRLACHVILEQPGHVFDLGVGRQVLGVVREMFEDHLKCGLIDEFRSRIDQRLNTVRSVIGGSTMVFSSVRMTIFHSSLSNRLSTVFSHDWAYIESDPSSRSISGRRTSSASMAIMLASSVGGAWNREVCCLTCCSRSPSSRTLPVMRGSKLEMY